METDKISMEDRDLSLAGSGGREGCVSTKDTKPRDGKGKVDWRIGGRIGSLFG